MHQQPERPGRMSNWLALHAGNYMRQLHAEAMLWWSRVRTVGTLLPAAAGAAATPEIVAIAAAIFTVGAAKLRVGVAICE